MTGRDLTELALPEGYRLGWKFCWVPTVFGGRTIWLRSIPVLQRGVKNMAMGINWGHEWVTVAVLDGDAAAKPLPVGEI